MKKIQTWYLAVPVAVTAFVLQAIHAAPSFAQAAYDDIVEAADITGLHTTQSTLLVGIVGFVVLSVAFAIVAATMKKAKGAAR